MKRIWVYISVTAGLMSAAFLTSCGDAFPSSEPAPILTNVTAANGPSTGGTSVTLTGQNFVSGATVTFGGAAAASVKVAGGTQITANTPSHAQGSVSVVVTNPDGQSGTLAGGFTFSSSSSILPSTGGGYWTGSVNGNLGVGLVDESGTFIFIADDGELYPGTLVISNSPEPGPLSFSGSVQSLTPGKFPNYGILYDCPNLADVLPPGILSGTIQGRQSIGGTATFTCPNGTVTEGISLTFNALYDVPSSLATISGTYRDSATGTAFTINADGTVFAQDATTGCVINGTVSIINPSYDVYGIEVSYASCTGSLIPLNGVTLAGLAALDNTRSPEQLLAGVWSSGEPNPPPITPVTCPAYALSITASCPASITYTLVLQ